MTKKPYTELRNALRSIPGLVYKDSGDAEQNIGGQVEIEIADEQDTGHGVSLFFDINPDGSETFVCQE
jgi:hypothetical protein